MAIKGYITAADAVDAMTRATYMQLFDDTNSGNATAVDASTQVLACLRRAHAQVISYLPDIYKTYPPENPQGLTAVDNIPVLLKDAELMFFRLYAYQRHPEYVQTWKAEPGGDFEKGAHAFMGRIVEAMQQIGSLDAPPEPAPENVGGSASFDGPRIAMSNVDGTGNSGDW